MFIRVETMTFNCESTVMCALPKAIELNEEKWEYDAPQFFDFNRVGSVNDEALDDSSDYFSTFRNEVYALCAYGSSRLPRTNCSDTDK